MKMLRANRMRTPVYPPKPGFSPMAEPRRRLVALTAVAVVEPWAASPDLTKPSETCTLRATLSDGRTVDRKAKVTYRKNEREKVLERLTDPGQDTRADERAIASLNAMRDRRFRAIERVRGALQSEFGRGVWA